ncbi:MAG TPA: SEC-C metal-binding domain-containing protein, partial [Polyangia bacterium]|nr:SEC-C metal-binding domain-containing protein [Polyangia bacterium]
GQKDPKQEYKKEGFVIFGEMMSNIGRNVCEKLFHMQLQRVDGPAAQAPAPAAAGTPPAPSVPAAASRKPRKTVESGGGAEAQASNGGGSSDGDGDAKPVRRNEPKVGRNDPCPCGSGKKYKKCHGAVVTA